LTLAGFVTLNVIYDSRFTKKISSLTMRNIRLRS
jgi:hypothetical protein